MTGTVDPRRMPGGAINPVLDDHLCSEARSCERRKERSK